jgi:peptidoglycan/LPS O-acetylase OafA/YrhL
LNVVLFFTYGSYGKFLEDFAVGMLLSLLFVYAQQVSSEGRFNQSIRRLSLWLWGAGILLLVFVAMWHYNLLYWSVWPFSQSFDQAYNWLGELGFSLGFGLCILGILFGPATLKRPFEWRPLRWIGLISFSLYMWHLPLLIFFMTHVGNHLQGWNATLAFSLYWLWALLVIIPLSALSYLLIEKPGMRLGDRLRRRMKAQQGVQEQAGPVIIPVRQRV